MTVQLERAVPVESTEVPTRRRTLTAVNAVLLLVAAMAIAIIVIQQLHRTPWGLPGHRGIFWLSTLLAARWIIDRPGAALAVAAASSSTILMIDPTMGVHVVPYLLAALAIDATALVPIIRRHPWLMVVLAPIIHLVGVVSPFVHNLAYASVFTVLSGMWFYIRGHLMWGLGAGVVGMTLGLAGRSAMGRFRAVCDRVR